MDVGGTVLPWIFIASQVFPVLVPVSDNETFKGYSLLLQREDMETLQCPVQMRRPTQPRAEKWS